jgi:hypothetical protein
MLGESEDQRWMQELRSGTFVKTFATGGDNGNWVTILLFAIPLFVLLAVAMRDALPAARARPAFAVFSAAAAATAWLLVLEGGHFLYRDDNRMAASVAFVLAIVLGAAVVAARGLRSDAPSG